MGPTIDRFASPDSDTPYLSVVVTARNDDHGGNLLRRMQIFIDAWINQAKRHRLPCELILVEWNPPEDRERLAAALRWPHETGPCQVRIIEVPAEVHARYRYASVLPLYQMIAKNVGIRRARGEFILATNIDIIFSDELMQFLAERRLEKGRMYRIDRTDVTSDVPVDGTLDEQLAYSRSHCIRIFAREGSFALSPDGLRKNEAKDITRVDSGIHFRAGWFSIERYKPDEPFRWIGNDAEILADVRAGGAIMTLEIEVGPGIAKTPTPLQVIDSGGNKVAEWRLAGRSTLALAVPSPSEGPLLSFRLRTADGGSPQVDDPRILNFRVFRCDWADRPTDQLSPTPGETEFKTIRAVLPRLLSAHRKSHGVASLLFKMPITLRRAYRLLQQRGRDIFQRGTEFWTGEGWHELELAGGEKFRWAGQDVQLGARITTELSCLAMLVEPGPSLAFEPFVLSIRDASGALIGRADVNGLTYVEVALPFQCGELAALVLTAEGGSRRIGGSDRRIMNFRVHACGAGVRGPTTTPADLGPPRVWMAKTVSTGPAELDWTCDQERTRQIAEMGKPVFLHFAACGDFTLMAREHWDNLRGYPELDLFSMHLDSMLCCAAHHAGVREQVLQDPMRIYHIEHSIGSGWTPEGERRMYERLAQIGLPYVSYDQVVWLITQMRRYHAPVIFNVEDWGLADLTFRESSPQAAISSSTRS